jgi:phage terminase small subunit
MKLSRKALEAAAKETPIEHILGRQVSGALTPKQRRFAHEVAKGATKADAYRASYDVTSKHTMASKPYELMRDERIQREIDAYALAIEAEKHRTPAALRSLVIRGLVEIALKDDTKDAVRLQALKTLGTVTEVSAFTERKEVRTISSSDDARARVMQELRGILTAQATDATVIEADADSLLQELSVKFNAAPEGETTEPSDADPPTGHPPDGAAGVPRP